MPKIAVLFLYAAICFASSDMEPGSLPDSRLTPGDTLPVTIQYICTPGYTKVVRQVPAAVRRQAYAAYGRNRSKGVCCEVDHLVPLELGGSNRLANLWPEPYDILWNAKVKDKLENRLHKMVCAGQLDLAAAQRAIAVDWIRAYQLYQAPEPARKRSRRR